MAERPRNDNCMFYGCASQGPVSSSRPDVEPDDPKPSLTRYRELQRADLVENYGAKEARAVISVSVKE